MVGVIRKYAIRQTYRQGAVFVEAEIVEPYVNDHVCWADDAPDTDGVLAGWPGVLGRVYIPRIVSHCNIAICNGPGSLMLRT